MKSFSDYPRHDRTLIVAGIVFVCVGLLGLGLGYAAIGWWNFLIRTIVRVIRSLLPIALILLGVLIIWAARTGRLHDVFQSDISAGFHRSLIDRRLLGVCGGIAQSRNVDSTIVRLAVILIFVAFPLFTVLAYVLLAIVMQPE